MDTRLSLDSVLSFAVIDVIFMTQRRKEVACYEKRIRNFYLYCSKLSPAWFQLLTSNTTSTLSPTHTPHFVLFCAKLFSVHLLNFPSFVFCIHTLESLFLCEGHETAGMVSVRAVYEIAQVKVQDECFKIRNASLEYVVKCIVGSARSLGIKIVNE